MATGKRYYWIKLKDSFITSDVIDYIMSQPNGAEYVVLYQTLLLKTANTGGRMEKQIGEVIIPYDVAKIERDCKWFSQDTIMVALKIFESLGLIYADVDGCLVMAEHNLAIGAETDYAEQKRLQRSKSVDIVHSDVHKSVHTDIRDKRLDIRDKEIRDKEIKDQDQNILASPAGSADATEGQKQVKTRSSDADFAAWYAAYPRHTKKEAARKAYDKARKSVSADVLLTGAKNYAAWVDRNKRPPQYVAHPATWLNAGCWEDELLDDEAETPAWQRTQTPEEVMAIADRLVEREKQAEAEGKTLDDVLFEDYAKKFKWGGG